MSTNLEPAAYFDSTHSASRLLLHKAPGEIPAKQKADECLSGLRSDQTTDIWMHSVSVETANMRSCFASNYKNMSMR